MDIRFELRCSPEAFTVLVNGEAARTIPHGPEGANYLALIHEYGAFEEPHALPLHAAKFPSFPPAAAEALRSWLREEGKYHRKPRSRDAKSTFGNDGAGYELTLSDGPLPAKRASGWY